jgi:hypothetical protein
MAESAFQQVRPALGLNLGLVIVVVNEAAAGLLGRRPEELLGLELSHLASEPDLQLYRTLLDLKNEPPLTERRLEVNLATRDCSKLVNMVVQRLSGSEDVHYGITFAGPPPQEAIVAAPLIEKERELAAEEDVYTQPRDMVHREAVEGLRREEILGRLSRLLASCDREDEALLLVQDAALDLLPGSKGMVALFVPESPLLRAASSWGASWPAQFSAADCWSLKSGEAHLAGDGASKMPVIRNVDFPGLTASIPMISRGRLLGVFILSGEGVEAEALRTLAQGLARTLQPALGRLSG